MTRRTQNRRLLVVVTILIAFIALALLAKLDGENAIFAKLYDFIKDTSLLIATVAVAYLANIFQKRQQFLQSLREQWREMIEAKSALVLYCEIDSPTLEDYLVAAHKLSKCIDNMRIVYASVGETEELIGLFPYSPLHYMREVLEKLHPSRGTPSSELRHAVREEIWDAFNVIRDHFLDEFDIEEPTRPILVYAMKRGKRKGATARAQRLHDAQLAAMGTENARPAPSMLRVVAAPAGDASSPGR